MPPFEVTFTAASCLSTSFFYAGKQEDKPSQKRQIAVRGPNGKYCIRTDITPIDPDLGDIVAAKAGSLLTMIMDRKDNYDNYRLPFLDAVEQLRDYEARQPARLRVTRAVRAGETHVIDGVPKHLGAVLSPEF